MHNHSNDVIHKIIQTVFRILHLSINSSRWSNQRTLQTCYSIWDLSQQMASKNTTEYWIIMILCSPRCGLLIPSSWLLMVYSPKLGQMVLSPAVVGWEKGWWPRLKLTVAFNNRRFMIQMFSNSVVSHSWMCSGHFQRITSRWQGFI